MRTARHYNALLILAIVSLAGCNMAALRPGEDAVVVNAERTINISHATCKAFLSIENENRALVREQLPAVHNFAESLRVHVVFDENGQPVVKEEGEALEIALTRQAYKAVDVYKSIRDAGAKADLDTKLSMIEHYAAQAQAMLIQIEQRRSAAGTP